MNRQLMEMLVEERNRTAAYLTALDVLLEPYVDGEAPKQLARPTQEKPAKRQRREKRSERDVVACDDCGRTFNKHGIGPHRRGCKGRSKVSAKPNPKPDVSERGRRRLQPSVVCACGQRTGVSPCWNCEREIAA